MGPRQRMVVLTMMCSLASFHADTLEECVAEHAVRFGCAPEPRDAARPRRRVNEPGSKGLLAHPLHHRAERVPREALNPLRAPGIVVDHPRRLLDVSQPRLRGQWEDLPANQRVSAG